MRLYHDLAEYYFSIECNHRDMEDDISFIRGILHGRKEPSLLDLGCGTGEHIERLTRYGVRCTGIDSSGDMLKIARQRCNNRAEFVASDMRNFDYYEDFDLVTCLFGSFDYMLADEDVDRVLWNTWRALKPEGIGLFEVWNSAPVRRIGEKTLSKVSTTYYADTTIERRRGFSLLNEKDKTVVEVNYRYTVRDSKGSRDLTDCHVMRAFTPEEMTVLLKNNGFEIEKVYASTLKEPFQERSSRMLIQFRKGL